MDSWRTLLSLSTILRPICWNSRLRVSWTTRSWAAKSTRPALFLACRSKDAKGLGCLSQHFDEPAMISRISWKFHLGKYSIKWHLRSTTGAYEVNWSATGLHLPISRSTAVVRCAIVRRPNLLPNNLKSFYSCLIFLGITPKFSLWKLTQRVEVVFCAVMSTLERDEDTKESNDYMIFMIDITSVQLISICEGPVVNSF